MRIKSITDIPKGESRDRWTVIDVDEKAILKIKKYADAFNLTTGNALSEVINKALADQYIIDELEQLNNKE